MSDPGPDDVVEARGLTKRYGDTEAVRGLDFSIRRGECFGFLGPNGAGKTSTMRMIYRAAMVSSGHLEVVGLDASRGVHDREIKRQLGVVPQDDILDLRLSVRENLRIFGRFYGLRGRAADRRIDDLLEQVALTGRADALVEELSGGMRRRVQIARGLLGAPKILILDEPTTGLDPGLRHALWRQLVDLKRRDTTVVLTTHYMDEAEKLCDRLVVIDHGRIVVEGTPTELIARTVPPHVVEIDLDDPGRIEAMRARFATIAERVAIVADRLLLYATDGEALHHRVTVDAPELTVLLRRANLEDVFLAATGHGLEEA